MLQIKVGNYQITNDDRQFLLNRTEMITDGETKEEKERVSFLGYYPSLKVLLSSLTKDYVLSNQTDIKSLTDLKEAVREITEMFDSATDSINV